MSTESIFHLHKMGTNSKRTHFSHYWKFTSGKRTHFPHYWRVTNGKRRHFNIDGRVTNCDRKNYSWSQILTIKCTLLNFKRHFHVNAEGNSTRICINICQMAVAHVHQNCSWLPTASLNKMVTNAWIDTKM